jgi:DNA-binding NarL/FixJ family response regulator
MTTEQAIYKEVIDGLQCLECARITPIRRGLHTLDCKFAWTIKSLTPRELSIAIHLSNGLTVKDIATELGLSVKTIECHKHNMFRKLDCHSVVILTRRIIYELELNDEANQIATLKELQRAQMGKSATPSNL